jgi:hypothetical protein
MNEHIKELADRLWKIHPSEIDEMGLKTRTEFYEHELKKFAELIVKECIDICEDMCGVDNFVQMMHPRTSRYDCANEIKEHFGVK